MIQLLVARPGDAVATRKELLVATRHILATDFRRGFFAQVDVLLDEKALAGVGRLSDEARPARVLDARRPRAPQRAQLSLRSSRA